MIPYVYIVCWVFWSAHIFSPGKYASIKNRCSTTIYVQFHCTPQQVSTVVGSWHLPTRGCVTLIFHAAPFIFIVLRWSTWKPDLANILPQRLIMPLMHALLDSQALQPYLALPLIRVIPTAIPHAGMDQRQLRLISAVRGNSAVIRTHCDSRPDIRCRLYAYWPDLDAVLKWVIQTTVATLGSSSTALRRDMD